jgi:hypothetical protein
LLNIELQVVFQDGDFFMGQNEMILHLASKGMDVPVPIKNVNGTYQSLENLGRPLVNFINVLRAHFLYKILVPKILKPKPN